MKTAGGLAGWSARALGVYITLIRLRRILGISESPELNGGEGGNERKCPIPIICNPPYARFVHRELESRRWVLKRDHEVMWGSGSEKRTICTGAAFGF